MQKRYIPNRRADLGGLAKQEAQFLEGLGEGVFARHCVVVGIVDEGFVS